MAISNQMNQFAMSSLKASIAKGSNPFTLSVVIDPDETASLIPGDFVKVSGEVAGIVSVLKCAATDVALGVITASKKTNTWVAGDAVEIALFGSILWLESSAAITAGDDLEYVVSGAKVKTNAGVNPICATALTGAAAGGALVMAQLKSFVEFSPVVVGGSINNCPIGAATPSTGAFTTLSASGTATLATVAISAGAIDGTTVGATTPSTVKGTTIESTLGVIGPNTAYGVFTKRVRLTLAQVNAGYDIVAAVTGKKLRLVDAKLIAIGDDLAATANATGVAVKATQSASEVALFTVNLAQMTRSAVNRIGTASTAVLADGASFAQNDAATVLTIEAVGGTDLITSTYIDAEVTYAIEA